MPKVAPVVRLSPGDGLGQRFAIGIAAAGAAGHADRSCWVQLRDSHAADHRSGVRNHHRGLGILTVVVAIVGGDPNSQALPCWCQRW